MVIKWKAVGMVILLVKVAVIKILIYRVKDHVGHLDFKKKIVVVKNRKIKFFFFYVRKMYFPHIKIV